MTLTCGCDPTRGGSCTWCDGTAAEHGATPPAQTLPTPRQWAAAQAGHPDPWLVPSTAPTTPPF